jgi:RNase P/RNase MRP subunit p29
MTAALTPNTMLVAIVPTKLEDIVPGSFIGSAAMPQPDGTQRALEIHVFPESMRGTGEGHRPFDLKPQSTMTNGTVGSVTGTTGRTLTVKYEGGEKTIMVPPDTPIVTFEPAGRTMLAAGAHIIMMGVRAEDGAITATRISVGKDGLIPPM